MPPIAKWNPARDVWETDQLLICGRSVVFSGIFPTSGMTLSGVAYALPTWEPRTDDSGCSSSPVLPNDVDTLSRALTVTLRD